MKNSRVLMILAILYFLLAGCGREDQILPHALYYLDGSQGKAQVWRLERDGVTTRQITFEESGVEDFAVSPRNGALALVSGNSLSVVDSEGRNRRLIAEAPRDASLKSYYRNTIASPAFSADGRTLAYGWNGVHLSDLATNRDIHALTNPEPESDDAQGYARGVYLPVAWSPEDSRLLITMSYYEGYQLAVLQPGMETAPVQLTPETAVCCQFSWTPDGKSILAATPFFTGTVPGLWRYDAQTGEQTLALPARDSAGYTHFYGWPYQSAAGELTFFYASLKEYPTSDAILFSLVRGNEKGANIQNLHAEEFSIRTALWSPDGAFVVIVGNWEGGEKKMGIVSPGKDEIKILIDDASLIDNLTWGP
ncbi:MAG: hypothetical protein ABFD24_03555 [Anaerolineaceae bacterium]